jgi:hypothetical protein
MGEAQGGLIQAPTINSAPPTGGQGTKKPSGSRKAGFLSSIMGSRGTGATAAAGTGTELAEVAAVV